MESPYVSVFCVADRRVVNVPISELRKVSQWVACRSRGWISCVASTLMIKLNGAFYEKGH